MGKLPTKLSSTNVNMNVIAFYYTRLGNIMMYLA
jgi:hypothetical protein